METTRICQRCGNEYVSVSNSQKYCPECGKVAYGENAEVKRLEYEHLYDDCEHTPKAPIDKSLRVNKKKVCPQCGREYWARLNDRAFCPACIAEARELSLGRFPPSRANWRSNYVPIPLNQPFPGCEGHHINKTHIIYIPKELHQSVRHDLRGNKNMVRINALALEYLQRKP